MMSQIINFQTRAIITPCSSSRHVHHKESDPEWPMVECFPLTRATLLRAAVRKSELRKDTFLASPDSDIFRTINNSRLPATYYVVTRGRQGNSQFEHHFRADTVRLVNSRTKAR
jgi:hypothetical protein